MIWVAFFSQTGSEIVELSKSIKRKPDLLVTNNFEDKIKFHPGIRELGVTIMSAKHDMIMNYFRNQVVYNVPQTLISLHGYLRILPADICERYEVYNGHPGAIDLFPELKGKDPQVKAFELGHKTVGCVIHEVTAGVDEGKILRSQAFVSKEELDIDKIFLILSNISTEMWVKFIKYYL